MKTSNFLLIAAILVLLASIIAFDFGIKARYNKGDFRNPYEEFIALNFKDFDSIHVNASTMANVKFVQGPFKVQVFEDKADIVKVTQLGRVLSIDVVKEGENYEQAPFTLLISCPRIGQLVADDKYFENGKFKVDTVARLDLANNNRLIEASKKVLVEGFDQDSILIIQNNGSHVRLSNNRFKRIYAIVGRSLKSASFLTVDDKNVFDTAHFDIRNNSQVFFAKATIKKLKYTLATDAKVTFSGASVNLFQ